MHDMFADQRSTPTQRGGSPTPLGEQVAREKCGP